MRDLPVIEKLNLKEPEAFGNLAEKLNETERRTLATDLTELIKVDEVSMAEWATEAQGYLDQIEDSADQKTMDREAEGSAETPPPSTEMTLTAMIQFAARASDALLGEPDLAKGSEADEMSAALAEWVSKQLRTKDPVWILDTDPLVVHMSATGLAWRKRDYDDDDKEFVSHFIPSVGTNSVIINKSVRDIVRAPRITHQFARYPYEIQRAIQRKRWINYNPDFKDADPQAEKRFYECDAWLDLDGDEIDEPWTVTISRDDFEEVVRIRPRWSAKTIVMTEDELFFRPVRRFYPYRFLPNPSGGFFPMGFGKLLSRCQGSADQLLAAIVDTAKTEAENGGVMSGGGIGLPDSVEVKNNRVTTIPSERPLSDVFQGFPAKSVSAGSVAALEKIMTLGDRLAGTLNLLENAPASMTATMAKGIIDTGTQVQSAVHRRLVSSMTQEFRMFVQMADAYGVLPQGLSGADGGGVAVTADPSMATEMQRSALAGVYMQLMADPLTNWQEVRLRLYKTLRLPDPEKLLGQPPQPQLTPKEKADAVMGAMKQRTENLKVIGLTAVQLTTSLKNLVEAAGGMQNNRAALLVMAQLENAVQNMMQDATNVGAGLDGMAATPGNANAGQLPPSETGGGGGPVLEGATGAAGDAGAGGGLQ